MLSLGLYSDHVDGVTVIHLLCPWSLAQVLQMSNHKCVQGTSADVGDSVPKGLAGQSLAITESSEDPTGNY